MQLMGWDLSFYRNGAPSLGQEAVTPEVLIDLAGNAWSAFSIAPLFIASMGCAPWEYYKKVPAPRQLQPSESQDLYGFDSDEHSVHTSSD